MYETLDEALERFKEAMLAKFQAVAHKHEAGSVTVIGSALFDKSHPGHESYEYLYSRFREEVEELHNASQIKEVIEETEDVANMAFLLWWFADTSV